MGAIINGVGVGFFAGIFVSMYMTNFTGIILPVYMIYGIIAPLISAIAITIMVLAKKKEGKEKDSLQWFEENK
jgi:hypothetical protein